MSPVPPKQPRGRGAWVSLITDRAVCGGTERLEWAVEAAVAVGVDLVQLREKDLDAVPLLALAERLRQVTQGKALLFVNAVTRAQIEVALAAGADGVHLGEEALTVPQARALMGDRGLLIGRSVHDLAGARKAAEAGADLLQAGSVFPSGSHPGQAPAGVALVKRVASAVVVSVLGVGGITAANAEEVIGAGADGVAVIREVLTARSPYRAAQRLRRAVDRAYAARPTTSAQRVGAP